MSETTKPTQPTAAPPYIIRGEWQDSGPITWEGPRTHPYGMEAYCVLEPGGTDDSVRVRIYPSRDAALPYMIECGYEVSGT